MSNAEVLIEEVGNPRLAAILTEMPIGEDIAGYNPVRFSPREQVVVRTLLEAACYGPEKKYTYHEIKSFLDKPEHVDVRIFATLLAKIGRTTLAQAFVPEGAGNRARFGFVFDKLPEDIQEGILATDASTQTIIVKAQPEPPKQQPQKRPHYKPVKHLSLVDSRSEQAVTGDVRKEGPCKDAKGVNFYPGRGESVKPAIAVCETCTIVESCLEFAVANDEIGIWGGTSERQRRKLRRERRLAVVALAPEAQ